MNLTMSTISADLVCQTLAEGLITVKKVTYCDTPHEAGSVYVFKIVGTKVRIKPEYHVHWGPGNRADAASFKDHRLATGKTPRCDQRGRHFQVAERDRSPSGAMSQTGPFPGVGIHCINSDH